MYLKKIIFFVIILSCVGCKHFGKPKYTDVQLKNAVDSFTHFSQSISLKDTQVLLKKIECYIKGNTQQDTLISLAIYKMLVANKTFQVNKVKSSQEDQLFEESYNYTKQESLPVNIRLWITTHVAWYAYSIRDMQSAAQYYGSCINILNTILPETIIDPCNTYKRIGYFLGTIQETKMAIDYLKQGLHYCNDNENNLLKAEILDNIGTYYSQLLDDKNALAYFDTAMIYAKKGNDQIRMAKILGNKANVLTAQKQYEEAITLLLEDKQISLAAGDSDNLMFANDLLSNAYINIPKVQEANKCLDTAIFIARQKSYRWSDEFNYLQKKLSIIHRYHLSSDTTDMVLRLSSLRDIIDDTDGKNAIRYVRMNFANQQSIKKNEDINHILSNERKTKRLYGLLAFLLLVIILLVIKIFRKNIQHKESSFEKIWQNLETEKKQSEIKLAEATENVASYVTFLNERNQQIQVLKDELEKHKTNSNEASVIDHSDKVRKILETHLLTEENWKNFKQAFIRENKPFYQQITTQYPTLTESNMRIIFLTKLGLTNSEIANVLGVTYDAVKKAKQRLKSKLGLDIQDLIA